MPIAALPFILPRGITGFGDRRPHGLFRKLTALAHAIARDAHGRVINTAASDLTGDNFHRLHLEGRGTLVAVFLNAFCPLVGFAESADGEFLFTDIPDGFLSRDQGHFIFISRAVLASPPDENSLSSLAPAEMGQLNYWRPSRLGDIIFNRWD